MNVQSRHVALIVLVIFFFAAPAGPDIHPVLQHKLNAQSADSAKPMPADLATPSKDKLNPESFGPLHKLIQPEAGEYRWDEVTWLTSIWHARKKAAAENKAIFIFGTQGAGFSDPLGNC